MPSSSSHKAKGKECILDRSQVHLSISKQLFVAQFKANDKCAF